MNVKKVNFQLNYVPQCDTNSSESKSKFLDSRRKTRCEWVAMHFRFHVRKIYCLAGGR